MAKSIGKRCNENWCRNTISRKICGSTLKPRTLEKSKSPVSNAAATSASSRKNLKIDPPSPKATARQASSEFGVGRSLFDVRRFLSAYSRQAFHPGPGRSFGENDGRFFAADDRTPRGGF